ncbi:hypothetical protein GLAREA_01781 [Glarea lozoyensis ATCC 20868]|uniref:Uncharacterized protein n=1 Tax=Glarea lozoyensis (strain ATCC 20868 / MF5171) TaxID=1116229 RepID=S3CKZ1_GLAL2|nr:uncharacterized protein GLAREA_01781 [Glarea lozoyensis ATCC 20868]EPE25869.1 hypothetical protein GLAREA_01781 [Glarea lozoyensis ATCC 20868]
MQSNELGAAPTPGQESAQGARCSAKSQLIFRAGCRQHLLSFAALVDVCRVSHVVSIRIVLPSSESTSKWLAYSYSGGSHPDMPQMPVKRSDQRASPSRGTILD